MPTRITQIDDTRTLSQPNGVRSPDRRSSEVDSPTTVLKVEGTLYLKDTELLEKICRGLAKQTQQPITLDLADINFLDSDGAAVLCRMKREQGVRLEGLHLFIAKVVELSEAEHAVSKYLPEAEHRDK